MKIIPRVLFASVLVVLLSAFQSTPPEAKSTASQSIRIYAAAALFNGRETFFNVKLIEELVGVSWLGSWLFGSVWDVCDLWVLEDSGSDEVSLEEAQNGYNH